MAEAEYNFEEFTSFGSKYTSKISLSSSGGFGFSAGFYHLYDLKGSKSLKLYFDKTKNAIAFKFLNDDSDGAIKLKPRETGGYVTAKSFLGQYKISAARYANRYEPKEINDSNLGRIFVIELRDKDAQDQIQNVKTESPDAL